MHTNFPYEIPTSVQICNRPSAEFVIVLKRIVLTTRNVAGGSNRKMRQALIFEKSTYLDQGGSPKSFKIIIGNN